MGGTTFIWPTCRGALFSESRNSFRKAISSLLVRDGMPKEAGRVSWVKRGEDNELSLSKSQHERYLK
jgi:hypothetical protein